MKSHKAHLRQSDQSALKEKAEMWFILCLAFGAIRYRPVQVAKASLSRYDWMDQDQTRWLISFLVNRGSLFAVT